VNLALCDDHLLFVESLATVFASRGHEVVTSTDPAELLEVLTDHPVDVCLIDLVFPTQRSTHVVQALLRNHPATKVVLLTGFPDSAETDAAARVGVRAVVSKSEDIDEVVRITERVAGEAATSVAMVRRTRSAIHSEHLTAREREVLVGLATGANTTALAKRLGITSATARSHVQNLLAKLGVHSRLEAVAEAVRRNLLVLDEEAGPLGGGLSAEAS
jgi:DNA-binding NarL/FixJ family response regulator